MAIEITPKKEFKFPLWAIISGSICLVLLCGLLVSYFYFVKNIERMSQEIQKKEEVLIMTPEEKALENELSLVSQRVNDFGNLLSGHKRPLGVFKFLEKICLPNVWFSNFNFNSEKGEAAVSGQTNDFLTLEHQLFVFRQEPLIKNFNVSGVSMSEEEKGEKVNFSLQLTLDPQVFR